MKSNARQTEQLESHAHYAAGFCQGWITAFAHTSQVSEVLLTDRVAQLLRAGGHDGAEDQVSDLPDRAASPTQRLSKSGGG